MVLRNSRASDSSCGGCKSHSLKVLSNLFPSPRGGGGGGGGGGAAGAAVCVFSIPSFSPLTPSPLLSVLSLWVAWICHLFDGFAVGWHILIFSFPLEGYDSHGITMLVIRHFSGISV
ncbi:Uncharacterized protein Fot_45594 [Forsythia ovata]|uniref:Uncharacterized protein n=1 Tax=Forsythia ovata TaxID=205694 RepID=A0ABD1R6W3_9LAMI